MLTFLRVISLIAIAAVDKQFIHYGIMIYTLNVEVPFNIILYLKSELYQILHRENKILNAEYLN